MSKTTLHRLLFLAFVFLAQAACTRARGHSPPPGQAPREYRVGPEDLVEIRVWKEPELSISTPVLPDGRISVPVVGELVAAGRTVKELEREIEAGLKRVLTSPIVSVSVKEVNAARVFIIGEVTHPGVYPIRGKLTVLHALALAGGMTAFADKDEVTVLRRESTGEERRFGWSYDQAVRGGQPFELEPGDVVVVP